MKQCDYKGCTKEATTKGYIYGHVKDSGEKDSFFPVHACDTHKLNDGFYSDNEDMQ